MIEAPGRNSKFPPSQQVRRQLLINVIQAANKALTTLYEQTGVRTITPGLSLPCQIMRPRPSCGWTWHTTQQHEQQCNEHT